MSLVATSLEICALRQYKAETTNQKFISFNSVVVVPIPKGTFECYPRLLYNSGAHFHVNTVSTRNDYFKV